MDAPQEIGIEGENKIAANVHLRMTEFEKTINQVLEDSINKGLLAMEQAVDERDQGRRLDRVIQVTVDTFSERIRAVLSGLSVAYKDELEELRGRIDNHNAYKKLSPRDQIVRDLIQATIALQKQLEEREKTAAG